MKEIKIKVERCFECPHRRVLQDEKGKIVWCGLAERQIEHIHWTFIPDWCPLPEEGSER